MHTTTSTCAGWSRELPATLQATEEVRFAAMLAGDTRTLGRILCEDLTYTHSNGQTDSKIEYLDAIEQGRIQYLRCTSESTSCLRLDEHAAVRGTLQLEGKFNGVSLAIRIQYLAVWIRHGDEWLLASWSSTRPSA